jgi:hypothetical protein
MPRSPDRKKYCLVSEYNNNVDLVQIHIQNDLGYT